MALGAGGAEEHDEGGAEGERALRGDGAQVEEVEGGDAELGVEVVEDGGEEGGWALWEAGEGCGERGLVGCGFGFDGEVPWC